MTQSSEEVFNRLCQTRADLALVLCQRLIKSKSTVPEMQTLLGKIWETIRSSNLTFEIALGSGDPSYYRTLLKLLFIGLRVHSEGKSSNPNQPFDPRASLRLTLSSSVGPIALEILDRVVGSGLRDLAAFIHDSPSESSPEDLSLITGILQACLRIPGIELSYSQVVTIFLTNDSPRIATTLFSWSDSLAISGDPIYGELSTSFLVELSTVPAMAEELAIQGILGHISAANITSYLRQGNIGPFVDTTGLQRCYRIWVKGILPLVLNLLDAVGAPIASEVSLFLNQFPVLLKKSSEAFDAPETSRTATHAKAKYIALSTCSEVHTTSLILFILGGFRDETAGIEIPEVAWDTAAVLENVEFWLGTRAVFRERVLPLSDREIAMSKMKLEARRADDPINQLEEKAVVELLGIRDVLGGEFL
jgi:nuclear pore complex protein Nup188